MGKDYVTLQDLKKLNGEAIPLKYRLLYTTLWYSGMRPGEVLKMKPGDFHKELLEENNKTYYFYDLKTQKNGTENELTPIRQQDYIAIMDYVRLMKIGPTDFIFGSSRFKFKKKMSVSWLDRMLENHLPLVGIDKDITAHSFRSGFVTYLRKKNVDYNEISIVTRHQNIDVMKKHYDKRIKYSAFEMIEAMEKI